MNHKKEIQLLQQEIDESKLRYSRLNDELTQYKHKLEEKAYMLQVQYSNYTKERAITGNSIIYIYIYIYYKDIFLME
jgi:FtsZ-binding cell division protein ZapB